MNIYYGTNDIKIDVTNICFTKLIDSNRIITIPETDLKRTEYFTDPCIGVHKKIMIGTNEYDEYCSVKIDIDKKTITSVFRNSEIHLISIHSKLKIKYGTFKDEYPEQLMSVSFLKGHEKVLELGGNIGRNSMVIASILRNQSELVVMESDINIAKQLRENREINNMSFHVESSALSKRKLIQNGWSTKPSDTIEPGFHEVPIINFDQLQAKYNIVFDTLVIDCEGALYYILQDMPDLLTNINLIIMENDYHHIEHKKYIDDVLKKYNMSVVYTQPGGWGPCYSCFYEVWQKS